MPIIVDASATMAWCFEDEATADSMSLWVRANAEGLLVPCIWPLEIANGLLLSERRRRMVPQSSDQFVFILDRVIISVDQPDPSHTWSNTLLLARETGLTVYDASYLELSLRTGLELATRDARLRAAAAARGVKLIAT